jgi:uncharacterized membrane protein
MASSTGGLAVPHSNFSRWTSKHTLWLVLGLLGLYAIAITELPILHDKTGPNHDYLLRLIHDRFLLFPHIVCGSLALLSGPLQFSSGLRRKHLQFHRVLGRIYVASILIAATLTFILTQGSGFEIGTYVQSGAWIVCTLAALLTARNRQIVQHRQWMIRSYAVTFTFITLRIPNFWPRYLNMSAPHFTITIIIVTFLSVFLPDFAFNWRELTTRRA